MALESVIDIDKGMQYKKSDSQKEESARDNESKCSFKCGKTKEIQYERVIRCRTDRTYMQTEGLLLMII